MTKRTKSGQARHDKAVLRSAQWYEGHGYKAKADLPGYTKPKKIEKFVPDLIAAKGKKEIVVEIETKDSNKKDTRQHQVFQRYTDRKPERDFKKKVI